MILYDLVDFSFDRGFFWLTLKECFSIDIRLSCLTVPDFQIGFFDCFLSLFLSIYLFLFSSGLGLNLIFKLSSSSSSSPDGWEIVLFFFIQEMRKGFDEFLWWILKGFPFKLGCCLLLFLFWKKKKRSALNMLFVVFVKKNLNWVFGCFFVICFKFNTC